jgi:hypothetical protein
MISLLGKKQKFLEKCFKVHGNRYDYSLVEYVDTQTKVKIICDKHKVFEQKPHLHRKGHGCTKCGNESRRINNFEERSNKIFDHKYDYSLVNYVNNTTKVKIKCPYHGIFEQTPMKHLSGHHCIYCSRIKSNTGKFIKKANLKHNNKYSYSLVNYVNSKTKVEIECHEHGVFHQTPNSHLLGYGCSHCSGNYRMNADDFIIKCKDRYGNKYDYTKTVYINAKTKVGIKCHEHGYFFKIPYNFLKGYECKRCSNVISLGENQINSLLCKNQINFLEQHSFDGCKHKNKLQFDFYLPEHNTCIEYDGKQHFESIDFFGGEESFNKQKIKDNIKNKYCKDNNIELIRIPYWDFNNIEKIINKICQ